jgi:acyl carrier protein
MERSDIMNELTRIIRDVLNNQSLVLNPETTAADVPDWDSVNHINIVVAAEQAFGIKFRTAEIEELRNIGEMVALIEKKLSQPR